ncbi:hypothetical protein ONZ45_g8792 [Pleurotus djamor]|nr:hypothetical protein ONZ45_g8792 [Pleurotus djamor]
MCTPSDERMGAEILFRTLTVGKEGLPAASLPDPGVVFDCLLKKREHKEHSGGMSGLIFAFASIVTHSLFRTSMSDGMYINNTSSYLDLSPLYGHNQAAQDQYIANRILKLNEWKRWSDPPPPDPAARALQDEEIFQTARLINCGHFMSQVMGDYVAGFLGSSEGVNWNMNAFDTIKTKDVEVPRGQGNHVSVEFNILYRWHATTSASGEEWSKKAFKHVFGVDNYEEVNLNDGLEKLVKSIRDIPSDPKVRSFAGLNRHDGRFSDDDLARILHDTTEEAAGAFGGRGTPSVLRIVEMMGMMQARRWGVCTMNEFRHFLGLRRFKSFEEWNPDKEIAHAARQLYGHIDNLELYAGLQAEETMPLQDGSRFACGYTTTRAVLGDAIALVRGDRFYTTDFTPSNLTTWGFKDCQRDMNNGGFGGHLPKLLMRTLPRHYPCNSVYTLFPFFTPKHMKESLTRQGIAESGSLKYQFERPVTQGTPVVLNNFTAIDHVFGDPVNFKTIYEKYGYGSILMFDDADQHARDFKYVYHALFPEGKDSIREFALWFGAETKDMILKKTIKYDGVKGNYIDVIKDVINMVACKFAAEKLCGIQVKSETNPSGIFTEKELFDMLVDLFSVTFLTFDEPEVSFALHTKAMKGGAAVGILTAKSLLEAAPSVAPGFVARMTAKLLSVMSSAKKKPCYPFLSRIAESGRPVDELLGNILGVAVGSSTNFSQAVAQVVDFFLHETRSALKDKIMFLLDQNDEPSNELLQGYVREAMRLNPQFPGLWREAAFDASIPQGEGLPSIPVRAGDRIFASFRNAHLDPDTFPNPTQIDPQRPVSSYRLNGTGFHTCPGTKYAQVVTVEIMRAIFSLKNLRRAPGEMGKLHGFTEIVHETETNFYLTRDGGVSPWPGSLYLVYDEDED